MTAPTERPCILCGNLTSGSVGAAGIKWTSLCQICKDDEDAAALAKLKMTAAVLDVVGGR